MASIKDFNALLSAINTETDAIAAKIDGLVAQLQSGNLTADEEAAVLGDLGKVSDRLKTIGADSTNPIP